MAAVTAAKKPAEKAADTPVVDGVAAAAEVVPVAPPSPLYADSVFTSRTLVLPSGRTLAVARGQVAADDAEALAYLKAHSDFEPVKE